MQDARREFITQLTIGILGGLILGSIGGIMFWLIKNRPQEPINSVTALALAASETPIIEQVEQNNTTIPTPTAKPSTSVRPEIQETFDELARLRMILTPFELGGAPTFLTYGGLDGVEAPNDINFELDENELVIFTIIGFEHITYTLSLPDGRVITPENAAQYADVIYLAEEVGGEASGFYTQYFLLEPPAGSWVLNRSPSARPPLVFGQTLSPIDLGIYDVTSEYRVGDEVTVFAQLMKGEELIQRPNLAVSGNVIYGYDGQNIQTIEFFDDGTHGDHSAHDGIYTGRFIAEDVLGYAQYNVIATDGSLTRLKTSIIVIGQVTATFPPDDQLASAIQLSTPDDDNDGLIDALVFQIPFTTNQEGNFKLFALLSDTAGNKLRVTVSTLENLDHVLPIGEHSFQVIFSGEELRKLGGNGPYQLTYLGLDDISKTNFTVDKRENVYTTPAYQANDFEGPFFTIRKIQEQPIDSDGDGLFEALEIVMDFEVIRPANYQWTATLKENDRHHTVVDGQAYLDSQTPFRLRISANDLLEHGRGGSYKISFLAFIQQDNFVNGYVLEEHVPIEFTTSVYSLDQFKADPSQPSESPSMPDEGTPESEGS